VRGPRAVLYSFWLCVGLLVGLAVGDILAAARARSRRCAFIVAAACIAVLFLATLEHTVAVRPLTDYSDLRRPEGLYAWLKTQPYPRPYVEFPYAFAAQSYHRLARCALSGQPSAGGHSRYVLPLQYYLHSFDTRSLQDKLAMVAASPYRFMIQHGANDTFRTTVPRESDLAYVTNFGATYVFENPRPARTSSWSLSFRQRYPSCFPSFVYSISLVFSLSNRFSFVPENERPVRVEVALLDAQRVECGRLIVREELPFIIEGPESTMTLDFRYDAARGRLHGVLLRDAPWRMEKAPVASCALREDDLFRIRWLHCRARAASGRVCEIDAPVAPLGARWPYQWGIPVSYAHQAGGFDLVGGRDGDMPVQRSVGHRSILYLGRPPSPCTGVVMRVKSALGSQSRPLSIQVSLNGRLIGAAALSQSWQDMHIAVPEDLWRDINRFDFEYPRTYIPWCLDGSADEVQRCAVFASLSLDGTAETSSQTAPPAVTVPAPPKPAPHGLNLLRNPRFDDGMAGWYPWQEAKTHTNLLGIVTCGDTGIATHALCIRNPAGTLVGVKQSVQVVSGKCYRLSGWARSTHHAPASMFGGRIGFNLPPQRECELVWMTMKDSWLFQETIVTNMVTGTATVFVHVGYGGMSSTGEFADVSLDEL